MKNQSQGLFLGRKMNYIIFNQYVDLVRPQLYGQEGVSMRIFLIIVGALLILMGVIWFLQGINVLPGSFMTGHIRWAVYGGVAVAAGVLLIVLACRRRASAPKRG
jgi:hypothetical protein